MINNAPRNGYADIGVRVRPDLFAVGTMLMLCTCWGFQQIAIKIIAADIVPIMQIALRSGLAAVVLGSILQHRGDLKLFNDGTLLAGVAVGILFSLEFLFVAEGLVFTTAAHMVVYLYTAPVFAALGLHLLVPDERLEPWQWMGVSIAFGGIALAFLGQRQDHSSSPFGDVLALSAGVSWGATEDGGTSSQFNNLPRDVCCVCHELNEAGAVA